MTKEALKMAQTELLRILECLNDGRIPFDGDEFHETLNAIKAALEQSNRRNRMTKGNIMKMAEQAGLIGPSSRVGYSHEATERFAQLVAAAERETCAFIAEQGFKYAHDGYEIADKIRSQS